MAKYLINRSYQIASNEFIDIVVIAVHCHLFGKIKPVRYMLPEEIINEMIQIIKDRRNEINEIKSQEG
jgi:hypothetical protein